MAKGPLLHHRGNGGHLSKDISGMYPDPEVAYAFNFKDIALWLTEEYLQADLKILNLRSSPSASPSPRVTRSSRMLWTRE